MPSGSKKASAAAPAADAPQRYIARSTLIVTGQANTPPVQINEGDTFTASDLPDQQQARTLIAEWQKTSSVIAA